MQPLVSPVALLACMAGVLAALLALLACVIWQERVDAVADRLAYWRLRLLCWLELKRASRMARRAWAVREWRGYTQRSEL